MTIMANSAGLTWGIAALATGGVIVRPWRLPEALWAVVGAAALVGLGLLPWTDAVRAVAKGLDVYFFLIGMMVLAELARQEGFFDWVAALAVEHARGSPQRLFTLVYLVGTVVTVLLSNDATAVVLTPAVYAAARAAGATPLPYLFVCVFIANAASFVLPISNPANLVIFDGRIPDLTSWLAQFGLPSVASIAATYLALRWSQRRALRSECIACQVPRPELSRGGRMTAGGLGATAITLILCSTFDLKLGLPTFVCGCVTATTVLAFTHRAPWSMLRGISWGVPTLVAGLFVLVEGLDRTGAIAALRDVIRITFEESITGAAWSAGILTAIACNLMNNLPVGLIAGSVMTINHAPSPVMGAMLIGVDLGPNLSITGSLATILWLVALRREGEEIDAWRFLRLGVLVMPPALILSLGALLLLA